MAEATYEALMLVVKLHELRDVSRNGSSGVKRRRADIVLEGP
jgi:hypothetical protein